MVTFGDQAEVDAYVRRVVEAVAEEHVRITTAALSRALEDHTERIPASVATIIRTFVSANNALLLVAARRSPLPQVPR
jgi:uncharacterized protein YqgV (UPF0045/DUF77 family)